MHGKEGLENLADGDPRRIGRYTTLARLGVGGMGTVYLGRSPGGRTVAVKVARAELAGDLEFRARFRREVAMARRVSGAFTAPVLDADPDAPAPWLATAFVPGVSLHDAVTASGPFPEDSLRMLVAGLAEAVDAVHRAGVVHRDFKPSNVLLTLDGPRVIDFGISRSADVTAMTSTGAVLGSVPYMSPEQARGQQIGPASDIFSLGSTIAFAATGAQLFGGGAAAAVLFRIVTSEPDLSAIPAWLRDVVAACLAKDPAARPGPRAVMTAVERQDAAGAGYRGWLPGPVEAQVLAVRRAASNLPEPGPAGPARPFSRRALLLGAAGGTLAVAGAGTGIGFALTRGGQSGTQPPGPARTPQPPSAASVPEAALSWQVTQPVPCPQVISAPGGVVCLSVTQATMLNAQGQTDWTAQGASAGVAFAALGDSPGVTAALDAGTLLAGAFSPTPVFPALVSIDVASGRLRSKAALNGQADLTPANLSGVAGGRAYVVTLGENSGSGLWCVDVASGRTVWSLRDADRCYSGTVAPGGQWLVWGGLKQLRAFTPDGQLAWALGTETGVMATAGPYFAITDATGTLRALEPGTGKQAWSADKTLAFSSFGDSIATNPDSGALYCLRYAGDAHLLACLDITTGQQRWAAPFPAGSGIPSTRLLYADGNVYSMSTYGAIWAFNAADGTPRWKYPGTTTQETNLAWAAGNGRLVLSNLTDKTVAALPANGA